MTHGLIHNGVANGPGDTLITIAYVKVVLTSSLMIDYHSDYRSVVASALCMCYYLLSMPVMDP